MMKKRASVKLYIRALCAVLAIVLMAGALPVQAAVSGAATDNSILYNGSFDLSNLSTQTAPGWGLNQNSANHTVTIRDDVVYGNSGYALKIEATGQSYIYSANFSVESGATYLLSYWVRVDAAQNLKYAAFLNDSSYSGGWWQDYVTQPVSGVTDGWQEVHSVVTIPESVGSNPNNPDSKIQLGLKVYAGSGTIYLDAVSFEKLDIHLDDPNLSFEQVLSNQGEPANWQTKAEGVQIGTDSAVYHDGTRSMYVNKTSLKEYSTVESTVYLPVTPENVYEFSFWMSSRNASPTATVRMDMQPYGEDGEPLDQVVYGTTAALPGGKERSDWTKVVTRAAPPAEAAYVSLRFTLTRGSAELWLDDIFFNVVEDGTDCVVYYEDFHAVDECGNISSWKVRGNGSFTAENGGKLTVTSGESYLYDTLECLATDYTYCLKGDYSANIGGTVQVRFYDYQYIEYEDARQTVPLMAGGTAFAVNFTAPSHTYAAIYIGSDQAGIITVENVTVYMTAQPPEPNKNYLDADWSEKANRDNVVSSVEIYNGIPTLMIDGQPTASYFYLRPDLNAYLQTDAESRIGNSGLELYVTYGGNLYKGGCAPIWLEDGSIDYDAFDAVIYDTLAASDDAIVMVNIGMFAPQWWLEQNPEHQAMAYNGSSYIALGDASLGSEKFRQEAGEILRSLLSHMKAQNYYNRVFGIKISGGQSYEWMHLGTGADQGPDYSAASQEGFRTYLKNKYGTDAALQAAWGNNTVTLATAAAPGWEEKCACSNVFVGDVEAGSLSRNIVDWNLWLGEASADSFLYYCQIAKEETDDQIIVGGYNGYLWTSNTHDSQGKAHTAMDRVLDSEYVDWIASPIAYSERLLGQSSAYMALLDTVQAHGKLYIAEQDNRTCLSDSYAGASWDADWDYKVGQTRTMADTLYQQKRDFANALVNGAGLWQFDMYGGWLDDDQIYEYIRSAKAEYDLSVHLDRDTTNEIAVFVGDETYAYLTAENSNMSYTLLEPMLMQQRKHLAAMGAGYDTYAMSSLLDGKVPSHKLNIILSPFEINEQMHNAIDTYLKTNGQVVVWVYLPGISTGTELSLSNVARTTGFSVEAVEQKTTLQVKLSETSHPLTAGIAGLTYGNSVANAVSPLTYIKDTAGMTVLGYNQSGGMPGLAVKDMGDWISVYSAAPCLDVQLLRNLMKFAGCHSYSENSGDVIYSSNHYVALHSATAGEKTISLPGNYSVYDVFRGEFLSMNTNTITYIHQAKDTRIFRLMKPNTYTVTARVQSGKGSLSAPGLTQVTDGQDYSLKITPEIGYEIAGVTVNGVQTALDGNYVLQIPSVKENTVIRVSFAKQSLSDNFGFELGSFGDGVTGSGNASVVSDSMVHSGVYSLRLNHDGTARDLAEITVHVNPSSENRTLTVSYWAKAAVGAVKALHNGAHFFTGDWKKTQNSVYGAVYPSSTKWQQYTQTLTLPAGTEIFQYQLYADTVNADIYIDDISFVCDGQQMMINGSLERGNLTGSFTKFENTPEVIRSQKVHSGGYAGYITGNGVVTAEITDLRFAENGRIALSAWLRGTRGNVTYRIYQGNTLLLEGVWSSVGQWSSQTAVCNVPAGAENLKIQFSTTGVYYLDDLDISALPFSKTALAFSEIYSDGTWRLTADDLSLFRESYYKIPVVIDGVQRQIVAHRTSDMLCIYPDFFGVYGGAEPMVRFEIPAGAVLRAVDPALDWGEKPEGQCIQTKKAVTVTLAEGAVETWNLSLGGDLTVNFYAKFQISAPEKVQAVISVAGESHTHTLTDDCYDAQMDAYRFSIKIAAAQMTDEISVQLLYGGVSMWEETYTVLQYARYVLADDSLSAYHPLVREMLSYGGAAQSYFGYNTEHLASDGITGAGETQVPAKTETEILVSGSGAGIRFYGASLVFRDRIALRYYYTVSGDISGYRFTCDGETLYPVKNGEHYYVEIPDICPQDLDKTFAVTVNGSLTVSYSPMHYMVRMHEKGTADMKTLMGAIYNYHLAAKMLCARLAQA